MLLVWLLTALILTLILMEHLVEWMVGLLGWLWETVLRIFAFCMWED
jgi:hypothetical protein